MKHKTYSQSGFSVAVVLLIIVILGIIGGTGWSVWNKQKTNKTDNSNNATTSTTPKDNNKTDPTPVNYLTIKEWNVQAPYSGHAEFNYKIEENAASFTSKEVGKLGHGCTEESLVGIVVRYKTGEDFAYDVGGEPAQPVEEIAKEDKNFVNVGDYYYHYTSPQQTCAIENSTIHKETANTQESVSNELKALVLKLEEVK